MAWPPRSVASREERVPPILPNGVRAVPRMTVLGIADLSSWFFAGSRLERGPHGPVGTIPRPPPAVRDQAHTLEPLKVEVSQASPAEIDADLLVVGIYEGGSLPLQLADAAGAEDARGGYKKLAALHAPGGGRALAVGLGRS